MEEIIQKDASWCMGAHEDQWTKFKFIVGGFKIFDTPEEICVAMSLPSTILNSKVINFRKISETLRKIRSERGSKDVEKARAKYMEDEYQSMFSYKKRGKVQIMTKSKDIARRYRLQNRESVY